MTRVSACIVSLMALALIPAAGCTIKATTDTTLDASSNFLSSTTPGAWVTQDGLLRAEHKLDAFLATNASNLEQDIAQGRGEYLASFATLLAVPEAAQPEFRAQAQDRFSAWITAGEPLQVTRRPGLLY